MWSWLNVVALSAAKGLFVQQRRNEQILRWWLRMTTAALVPPQPTNCIRGGLPHFLVRILQGEGQCRQRTRVTEATE